MTPTCRKPSCTAATYRFAYCKRHYQNMPLEQRFRLNCEVQETGCWTWRGSRDGRGYGRLKHQQRTVQAHRWSYEHHVGPIPDGHQIDHLCRNRACVNPDHLEPVTQRENLLRGNTIVAAAAAKAACINGHDWSDPAVVYINNRGKRVCRTCRNERLRNMKRPRRGLRKAA